MPMSKQTIPEILTEGVREHQAVQAWLQIQSGPWEPGSLEVLQQRRYSTVYRLKQVKQEGARVIAKRCRIAKARIEQTIYQELMPLTKMPALCCYGLLEEPDGEFCWLFLEDAAGVRYSPHLPHNRALAGRWLAETQLAATSAGLRYCLPGRGLWCTAISSPRICASVPPPQAPRCWSSTGNSLAGACPPRIWLSSLIAS